MDLDVKVSQIVVVRDRADTGDAVRSQRECLDPSRLALTARSAGVQSP